MAEFYSKVFFKSFKVSYSYILCDISIWIDWKAVLARLFHSCIQLVLLQWFIDIFFSKSNVLSIEHWPQSANHWQSSEVFSAVRLWQGERQDSDVVEERNAQAQLEKAKVTLPFVLFHPSFITQVDPNHTHKTWGLSIGGTIRSHEDEKLVLLVSSLC